MHGPRVLLVRIIGRVAVRLGLLAILIAVLLVVTETLPPEWRPGADLDVAAPVTPLTRLKLLRALRSPEACHAALATTADFQTLPPLEGEGMCGIPDRVRLSRVGGAAIPLETACGTALRLAMWERHVLQPAARETAGTGVTALHHQGSYNCRAIRGGRRLSSHATAAAVDIRAVTLADGRRLELAPEWGRPGQAGALWMALRDGACDWFRTVLGPDYDANHADHLHLQTTGWGTCR